MSELDFASSLLFHLNSSTHPPTRLSLSLSFAHIRYLFALCCYRLTRLSEAESALIIGTRDLHEVCGMCDDVGEDV